MSSQSLRWKIRNTWVVDSVYRSLRNATRGRGWGAFHQDRVYQSLVIDLLEAFDFSAFVETGTYRGYSPELIATRFPKLPVFTVEVHKPTYHRSKRFLAGYPNVTALLGSSDETLRTLLAANQLGPRPLFFLDAHWESYWPLRKELELIGASGLPAVIVIDDFEVPGQPQFGFDVDGGADVTEGKKCNLDYIRPALAPSRSYRAAFPRYAMADGFPAGPGALRGHVILFQEMGAEYEAFQQRPLAKTHYFAHGISDAATAPLPSTPGGQ